VYKRNNEAPTSNNRCHGSGTIITLFVCNLSNPACNAREPFCQSVAFLTLPYFSPTISSMAQLKVKDYSRQNLFFLIISATIVFPVLNLKRTERDTVTNVLPFVLYGCEIWSLTLREERKLRVLENMVLRRIFGPRRDEVTGKWRRLHNEELNDLYSSPNIVRVIKSRRMRWTGNVARMGEERGVYRVLLGKP